MLRDYQIEMKTRLMEAWKAHRSVMVQMPTGTGKTHLLASVVSEFVSSAGSGVWLIAHRRELVAQMEETLAKYGIRREDTPVRVMSVQWLSRHWNEAGDAPGLIVIDEAHHALAASYTEMWKRYPAAKKLGVTATPCRLNRRGFTELFEVLVTSWSIAEFIEKGVLSVFDYVSIRPGSEEQRLIDGLEKRGADGDYQVKEMDAVLNRRPGIERLYRSVRQFASGKKGMVYAISIEHARRIAEYYSRRGVNAVAVDSKTPAMERKRMVEEFRHGKIEVLVNVDVFSEGFDCPDVEFVQLARPTLSLAKYLQQVGRGLRRSEGKEACMLIDNVGLYRIFGLPTQRWNWDAMFRGRMAGKGSLPGRMNCDASVTAFPVVERPAEAGGDLVVVMEHGRLLSSIREQALPDEKEQSPSCRLRAFVDKETGLWGLEKGDEMLPDASFKEVLSIKGRFAVGRLRNGCVRVLDDTGALVAEPGHCREVRFLKDDLLQVRHAGNSVSYVDLRNGRCYSVRPRVLRYGSIELLQANRTYYSRTRQVYANTCGLPSSSIVWMGFYVKMYDGRVPSRCRRMEDGGFCCEPQVCLLEGDEERAYYLSGRLPDQSIVVMDEEGRHGRHGSEHVCCGSDPDLKRKQ
jgi:superfamily II DNA or RNA helicase